MDLHEYAEDVALDVVRDPDTYAPDVHARALALGLLPLELAIAHAVADAVAALDGDR